MNHADVKRHLAEYLEGDLALDKRARFDSHLDDCRECAREVDEMRQTIRLMRSLPEPETPPMIAANVMRRIRAGETRPSWIARIGRSLGSVLEPSFVLPASAVAVAALVAAVVQEPDFFSRFAAGGGVEGHVAAGDAPSEGFEAGLAGLQNDMTRAARESAARSPSIAGPSSTAAEPPAPLRRRGAPATALADTGASSPGRSAVRTPDSASLRFRFQLDPTAGRGGLAAAPPVAVSQTPRAWTVADAGRGRPGLARRVAQPRLAPATSGVSEGSAGEDPRDGWLARGLEDPVGFAHFLAAKRLAEQELWVSRLADRAIGRGLLDELVETLRTSGDVTAAVLGDDFAAQAEVSLRETDRGEASAR